MMGYSLLVSPIRWRERWRFREIMTFVPRCSDEVASLPAEGALELVPDFADVLGVSPAEPRVAPLGQPVGSDPNSPRSWASCRRCRAAFPGLPAGCSPWRAVGATRSASKCWRRGRPFWVCVARPWTESVRTPSSSALETIWVSVWRKTASGGGALNAQFRQAAAWQIAAGISWRRRHVPTGVNVKGKTSRLVDDGHRQPGNVMVFSPAERRRAHRRAAEVARVLGGQAAPRRGAMSAEVSRPPLRSPLAAATSRGRRWSAGWPLPGSR